MTHSTAVLSAVLSTAVPAPGPSAREVLYKSDHPRAIDRYIDFFGEGILAGDSADECGERLLESLA
jgi:hypothetical protein